MTGEKLPPFFYEIFDASLPRLNCGDDALTLKALDILLALKPAPEGDLQESEFGRLDILVNNAGVTRRAELLDMSEEDWDYVLDTNLKGVFFCSQAAARQMIAQRYGKIINISSIAGKGWTDVGGINYSASKAAIIQLTKACARALGPYGINVNAIAPGSVDTPLLYANRTPEQVQAYKDNAIERAAIGRLGVPGDIANGVLFLASDHSSFIDGQTVSIDGGRFDLM